MQSDVAVLHVMLSVGFILRFLQKVGNCHAMILKPWFIESVFLGNAVSVC